MFAAGREIRARRLEQRQPLGGVANHRAGDGRLERPLGLGLRAPHFADDVDRRVQGTTRAPDSRVASAAEVAPPPATGRGGPSPRATTTRLPRMTNGRYGANSRSITDSAACIARLADSRAVLAVIAVAARLDELEIVVAEAPEERLGPIEDARVFVVVERLGGVVDQRRPSSVSMPRSSGWVTSPVRGSAAERELRRVQQLDREPPADLHLADVEGRVDAGAAARRPVAHAVGAVLLAAGPSGVTTLPLDFDIFLRSGSSTQPEIAACAHGSESCSRWLRSTVENSHVRMMSCACGRRSIGNVRAKQIGVALPAGHDLRRHRRGRPRVHHVGIADEAAGPARADSAV